MRQILSKGVVDSPGFLHSNVTVEVISDDDVNMEATVRSKQGVILEILNGPWTREGDAFVIQTDAGQAVISVQVGGCGCGGSLSTPKAMDGAAPGQGYLP
jgi:hypothetical protein